MANSNSGETSERAKKKMMTRIDSYQAADIARKFFEQYHSGVEVKDLELKDEVWFVKVGVGFLFEEIKEIEIDALTGKILRYY